ncbi:beta-galactoside-binding lectin-like [Archocentrus centrarchus]|uniref:beta-galactoside-binding lectin-like n=1 Tax=Archocentrus centrarchus TaxID=63155 RepID=UPI0011E9B99D|nr:beta-galactoside-binding lectin-like [Archocentrus centrarchus]
MSMLIKNMTFKAGQTLTVVGVIKPDPKRFEVNIGPSEDRIALHFNPRFNSCGDINTIVCNSFEAGRWCEEKHERRFPFYRGQEFKVVIKFTLSEFVVTLPCRSTFCFPNRIGAEKYSVMSFIGDARIRSIEIK